MRRRYKVWFDLEELYLMQNRADIPLTVSLFASTVKRVVRSVGNFQRRSTFQLWTISSGNSAASSPSALKKPDVPREFPSSPQSHAQRRGSVALTPQGTFGRSAADGLLGIMADYAKQAAHRGAKPRRSLTSLD
jgi:hypothetical protein